MDAQSLRQGDQRLYTDIALTALNEPYEIPVHICQLSQLFLTEPSVRAQRTDAVAKDDQIGVAFHTQCVACARRKFYIQSVAIQFVFIQYVLPNPYRTPTACCGNQGD